VVSLGAGRNLIEEGHEKHRRGGSSSAKLLAWLLRLWSSAEFEMSRRRVLGRRKGLWRRLSLLGRRRFVVLLGRGSRFPGLREWCYRMERREASDLCWRNSPADSFVSAD